MKDNYCPKCYSKLKIKTYWNENLGYIGMLDCSNHDFIFTSSAELYYSEGFETRAEARKDIIREFNKKYNPYKLQEFNNEN